MTKSKKAELIRKTLGDLMTVTLAPGKATAYYRGYKVSELRYTLKRNRITVYIFDTLLPTATFKQNSPTLEMLGLTNQDVLDWLTANKVKNTTRPEKRMPKSYPLYD